jgi:hypothetical protein
MGVFLATGNIAYLPMFLGVPLFLVVLLVFALNYARVARRSIALRFENSELVDQLREQTGRAAQACTRRKKPIAPSWCFWPRPVTTCASPCMRWACFWPH